MISTHENSGGTAASLATIEALTKAFADEHACLAGIVEKMQLEMEAIKRKHLQPLRGAVARTAKAKLTLHTAIAGSPALFEKPRTQIFHGVKVGFQKGKGGIEFADVEKTLALIRKHFGDEAIAYIRTVETPDKKMLADMPAAELKKIGATVIDTGDVVVIKPTDSEIEKTVAALLKDAVESEVQS